MSKVYLTGSLYLISFCTPMIDDVDEQLSSNYLSLLHRKSTQVIEGDLERQIRHFEDKYPYGI